MDNHETIATASRSLRAALPADATMACESHGRRAAETTAHTPATPLSVGRSARSSTADRPGARVQSRSRARSGLSAGALLCGTAALLLGVVDGFSTTAQLGALPFSPLAPFSGAAPRRATYGRSLLTSSLSLPPPVGVSSQADGKVLPVPRPSALPSLSGNDLRCLRAGLSVQKQTRDGWVGSGCVAMDVKASPEAVWSLLTDYARYDSLIDTVRESLIKPGSTKEDTRATFTLSKFRLKTAVVHRFNADTQQLTFALEEGAENLVLKEANGLWFVETDGEGLREGHCRVWLQASLRVSRVVPKWVVDYAARRALPRATSWLRPAAEEKQKQLEAGALKVRRFGGAHLEGEA